jgi:hypothetical protein
MSWQLEGTYFENCSCEMPCPCTISLDSGADYDRCEVLLAFHIRSGEIDGVDVGGLGAALVADAPKVMTDGNWRLGLLLDSAASPDQAEKLGAVFGGQLGGPPETLGPLLGEMLGVESAPFEWSENGLEHRVRIGDGVEVGVEDVVPFGSESGEPVQVTNVFHPANSTLTVSRGRGSHVSAFGLDFANDGKAGFSAPFSWSA